MVLWQVSAGTDKPTAKIRRLSGIDLQALSYNQVLAIGPPCVLRLTPDSLSAFEPRNPLVFLLAWTLCLLITRPVRTFRLQSGTLPDSFFSYSPKLPAQYETD